MPSTFLESMAEAMEFAIDMSERLRSLLFVLRKRE
jgi:hypothetical protein